MFDFVTRWTACSRRMAVLAALVLATAPVAGAIAQVTSLSMTSDSGDYIGLGQTYFLTPADGTFSGQSLSNAQVSFDFHDATFTQWWHLDFAAPSGQTLAPGAFFNAARYPFQLASQPGLNVDGDGRGCNMLSGSFQVLQSSFDANGNVLSFDATFVQYCEMGTAALRGEIRYNANVPLSLSAPSTLTITEGQASSFTVLSNDTAGSPVTLTASGLPAGASFVDNHNGTGSFGWTPTLAQGGRYLLSFNGTDTIGNAGAAYTQITVIPPPPPNDDFNNATRITSFPFSSSFDATNATTAPDDPWCYGANQTVWFAYTPSSNIRLEANTFGSSYDTTLSVYTGARSSLNQLVCNDDANSTVQSRVRFDATAATTYYFMVGSLFLQNPASLVFNLLRAPPPFSFTFTSSQFGSVTSSTGAVTVSGTVTCSSPAYVNLNGELKQMHAGVPINGYFYASVACNGVTPWTSTVYSQSQVFHGRTVALYTGGKASLMGSAYAFDPDSGQYLQRNISTTITLRGK